MNTQHKKNRITIIVVFAMSIIPFGIAWYLAANPDTVKLGTNNGELITPPTTTEIEQFSGADSFTTENLKELKGHWVMVNIINQQCDKVCADALYATRQVSLMVGKDIARLRRAVLMSSPAQLALLPKEWQEDARLLKIVPSAALQEKINQITSNTAQEGWLLLMDPLGNLMMKYAPGFDPYKVRNDLSKLLRISQIG
ncbi:MAG: hypothetical protein ACKN9F_05730 [Methylomonas sp.]